ncbi:protein-disulfide reductase DsbD [Brackiella oedipodis]|uniref:protein-disulfide reductase DsbD n=1 Tax=Brackiella oedipodis TaxID=124225 RepID=UPI00048FFD1B|nr:protein-disulfide reductase DsbD [Brackiella oedipodis]
MHTSHPSHHTFLPFIKPLLWLALVLMCMLQPINAMAEEEFLEPEQAFQFSAQIQSPNTLAVQFKIAPGYYLYKQRFSFAAHADQANQADNGDQVDQGLIQDAFGPINWPAAQSKYDPTFEQEMEIYHDQVTLLLPLQSQQAMTVTVTAQGCAEAGLCYPPMDYQVKLTPSPQGLQIQNSPNHPQGPATPKLLDPAQPSGTTSSPTNTESSTPISSSTNTIFTSGDTELASHLTQASGLRIIGLTFMLGVLLSFTPCVLPMLPILFALLVGQQQGRQANTHTTTRRGASLGLALIYVLGTSVVYTIMGLLAASLGSALSSWMQTPWVLSIFAILLALLALAMFANLNFQTPSAWQSRVDQALSKRKGGHYGSALVMGMLSALVCGPCVAAPLAGVLLFISQSGNLLLGALALFTLAWGQGMSLIVLGATSGALLPKAGAWMHQINKISGLLLLATAWWMVYPFLTPAVAVLGWAFLAALAALFCFSFKSNAGSVIQQFINAIGALLMIWSILLMVGLSTGQPSLLQPLKGLSLQVPTSTKATPSALNFQSIESLAQLQSVLQQGHTKPYLLEFNADWCVACREFENFTYPDPVVQARMQQFNLLQVDVSANTPEQRELLQHFKLFGPPAVIFFDANGQELVHPRVVGFENARTFANTLSQALP